MERLFSPCTRVHGLLESHGRVPPEWLRELNLDVSTDEYLSTERGFIIGDLYAMKRNVNTIAWLTPHAAIVFADRYGMPYSWRQVHECHFHFTVDGNAIIASASSIEHLLEICSIVLRLLAASVIHLVTLRKMSLPVGTLIDAASLAYLMEHCQSLKVLKLENLEMDENHCRVLGTHSRPGLKIVLNLCSATSAGTSALAEILGRNQGPIDLAYCRMDYSVLADGLRGNSRLKSLTLSFLSRSLGAIKRQLLALASALQENEGLLFLHFPYDPRLSDETWDVICDSLKTHPTLEWLNLSAEHDDATTAPAVLTSRIQALLDMMKINKSIHTISLNLHYRQHELFQTSVIPYLVTNRFRPRVRAIQKTRPIVYRTKVLGRALLSARNDSNSFWMLLSGNAEIAFRSRTTTIAAATSLPTPATTIADTINAKGAAFIVSMVAALTTSTLTDGLPVAAATSATAPYTPSASASDPAATTAANLPTPSAGQKRKSYP
jgi:hypothetical protein